MMLSLIDRKNQVNQPLREPLEGLAARRLAVARDGLSASLDKNDYHAAHRFAGILSIHIDCKFPLTREQRVDFTNLLMRALRESKANGEHLASLETRALHLFGRLLKKPTKLEETYVPLEGVVFDWRLLADIVLSECFRTSIESFQEQSNNALSFYKRVLPLAINKARRYFTAEAASEMLEEFEPFILKQRYFILASVLLPHHDPEVVQFWLNKFVWRHWSHASHSIAHNAALYQLLARTVKNTFGVIDWQSHLSQLMNRFVMLVSPDIAGQRNMYNVGKDAAKLHRPSMFLLGDNSRTSVGAIGGCMAKILVYTLSPGSKSMDLLASFFTSMKGYYHPSNSGSWSQPLGNLLAMTAGYYVKRLGRESRGTASYSRELYLDPKDTTLPVLLRDIAIVHMYSKGQSMQYPAVMTLGVLSKVFPELIVPLFVKQIQPALTSTGETRRMMAVLGALRPLLPSMLNIERNPQCGPQLQDLLFILLEGINAMDPIKTGLVMQVFQVIFLYVPLIDAVESDKLPARSDDAESKSVIGKHVSDEARGATMVFGEFAFAFIDKVLQLLRIQGKPEAAKIRATAGNVTDLILKFLHETMSSFFQALSPSLAKQVTAQIVEFIRGNPLPDAQEFFGTVLTTLGYAHPTLLLPPLLDLVYGEVLSSTDGELAVRKGKNTSELSWLLFLLSSAISTAVDVVGQHSKRIFALFSICRQTDALRKSAKRLFSSYLNAVTCVYPKEARSFSAKVWDDEHRWKHWESWARYYELEEKSDSGKLEEMNFVLDVEWHSPSKEKLSLAQECADVVLAQPLHVIACHVRGADVEEKVVDADSKLTGSEILTEALEQVKSVVDGAGVMCGAYYNDKKDIVEPLQGLVSTAEVGQFDIQDELETLKLKNEEGALVNLRHGLLEKTLALGTRFCAAPEDDDAKQVSVNVKAQIAWVDLLHQLICSPGWASMHSIHRDKQINRKNRSMLNDFHLDAKNHVRGLLVEREGIIAQQRLTSMCATPATALTIRAVEFLTTLSLSDFEEIRNKARGTLMRILDVTAGVGYDGVMEQVLGTIRNHDSSEEAMLGATALVQGLRQWMIWRMRFYPGTSHAEDCVIALLKHGQHHSADKVQTNITNSFLSMMHPFFSKNTNVRVPKGISEDAAEKFQARNTAHANSVRTCISGILELLGPNQTSNSSVALHWRYEVAGMVFLHDLLAAYQQGSSQLGTLPEEWVRFLTAQLGAKLMPVRKIAIAAVTRALAGITPAEPYSAFDMKVGVTRDDAEIKALLEPILSCSSPTFNVIKSDEEWDNTRFVDNLRDTPRGVNSGVLYATKAEVKEPYADRAVRFQPYQPLVDGKSLREMEAWLSANLPSIVTSLIENHPEAGQAEGDGSGDALANHTWLSGYGDIIPDVRAEGVQVMHIHFIAQVVRHFPALLYAHSADAELEETENKKQNGEGHCVTSVLPRSSGGGLLDQLARCFNCTDKEAMSTAAEIFAGIALGARTFSFSEQQKLYAVLVPTVEHFINGTTVEGMGAMHTAVSLVAACDPRRVWWLLELVAKIALNGIISDKDASPSAQAKGVGLLTDVALAIGDHGTVFFDWILSRSDFPLWLQCPYENVRRKISTLLLIFVRKQFHKPTMQPADFSNGVQALFASCESRLANCSFTAGAVRGDADDNTAANDKYFVHTIMLWISLMSSYTPSESFILPVVKLFPHCFSLQVPTVDADFASSVKSYNGIFAWVSIPKEELDNVVASLRPVSKVSSWHVRRNVLKYLKVFIPRHAIIMSDETKRAIYKFLMRMITDDIVDVRKEAHDVLAAFLSSTSFLFDEAQRDKMIKRCYKLCATVVPKAGEVKEASDDGGYKKAMGARHGGVLALSAMVACHPFDLPEFLPSVLAKLSDHAYDPSPINAPVRKLFAEFKRTHKEEWHAKYKDLFTDDELDKVNGVDFGASYYA